ncbi:IclR family transcriptional regulator [Halococcus sediminicola]|uniref:IclR family transcriptional regulator n=1 Tax=Halococcus sediminicola TaxID=1264579 RepID=UPI000679E218|nr:IclR family transcriptional regulator [Halococcus sediminicola]
MSKTVPVKTATRVFEIIEALLELERASLSELARHLDLADSTLHDHLTTLESLGYVVRENKKYQVSFQFLEIGEKTRRNSDIYQVSDDEVSKLASETQEHASLMVEENGMGVLLAIAKGTNAVNLEAYAGRRVVLNASAPGKAILAHLPEWRVEQIIDQHGLPEYTEYTVTGREDLFAELDAIRERGYATDVEELVEGVKAISVPLICRNRVRGAITVGGPANRLKGTLFEEDLPNLLLQSSNVIELNLAHW